MAGEVVGINTGAIREANGANIEGFGFAVAGRTIVSALPRLIGGQQIAPPPAREFPGYRQIAANLSGRESGTRWYHGETTDGAPFYWGNFNEGYFGVTPTNPATHVVLWLEPDVRGTRHQSLVGDMLLAVGYDGTTVAATLAALWPPPPGGAACTAPGQVEVRMWPLEAGPDVSIGGVIVSSASVLWREHAPC